MTTNGVGAHAALVANRSSALTHEPGNREGISTMDSWSETRSLIVLMSVIAVCYVLGRVVAEML